MMKQQYDLGELAWTISGWAPNTWREGLAAEPSAAFLPEVQPLPAPVPGSAQEALRRAGNLPDWNAGLQARTCEWVENRHWLYAAAVPDDWLRNGLNVRLRCLGLDYSGWILLNGREVAHFKGSHHPWVFDLTDHLRDTGNTLQVVFDLPPRWLGFGYTSQTTEWKPRFNYTWDWTPRLVQIGIWDDLLLEVSDGREIAEFRCTAAIDDTAGGGVVRLQGVAQASQEQRIRLQLFDGTTCLREAECTAAALTAGIVWSGLAVQRWWPNGLGGQPLYTVRCQLMDSAGQVCDTVARRVGFKQVSWAPCEGAPEGADPWICVVNGQAVFLQGVNWTPIRPNFADVTDEEYRARLTLYRDLGCNVLRVWGGAFLEKEVFYNLCDELGLLVWQEFPLSSSYIDNWPPEDEASISALAQIAESYIDRRQHHASLLLWCGGNELQGGLDGSKAGIGRPIDTSHPLIARLAHVVASRDPGRRFLPTSASGPRFHGTEADFGKGLHWDVHGPWQPPDSLEDWACYWQRDDALFRSEVGAPGASPVDVIRASRGELADVPGTLDNPLWRRTAVWIEWPVFVRERGREPACLEEYVAWSQERQARALEIAVRACKERFPRCGGVIVWMGHDCFPCTSNTAIVDLLGRPKPAAATLGRVFHEPMVVRSGATAVPLGRADTATPVCHDNGCL